MDAKTPGPSFAEMRVHGSAYGPLCSARRCRVKAVRTTGRASGPRAPAMTTTPPAIHHWRCCSCAIQLLRGGSGEGCGAVEAGGALGGGGGGAYCGAGGEPCGACE